MPGPEGAAGSPTRLCAGIARRSHHHMILAIFCGIAVFLVWATLTSIDRVTRGSGRVVSQTRNQLVQHFEGGIVTEILAREGENVRAGQPLVRIENSFAKAELQNNQLELYSKLIAWNRLDAEARGLPGFDEPPNEGLDTRQIFEQEHSLFRARKDGLQAQIAVIDEQFKQKQLELAETQTRWSSSQREREIVTPRVESLRRLVQIGAVSRNELLDNERSLQQVEARMAGLIHEIARLEAAVSELGRRREEVTLRFRAEAEKDQRETSVQIAKLKESISAMRDRSNRSEAVAPVAGTVNKLFVDTIGGVVKPGDPLAQIVPMDASLIVEARIPPSSRAQIWPGLPAIIKVSAYDFAVYGGLKGKVIDVSPDALADEKGEPYFRVRLATESRGFGPGQPVIPGMVAQVDIISGQHTIMSYVTNPINRMTSEALRQ
ncbi:MAG: HlyD family type I secretion periplasmic adaptor subunit [Beijerinckiaceae bacterium]|nr:HlyD family type I secretion periplasmic adaptor subunit [Beijerinckiaceae bacterium]MCZ8299084.1 HlyD family type I secretion periplasmic adaptor subunit [Beijerinckiaceae bacterium]